MIPESRIAPFENRALHFLDLTFREALPVLKLHPRTDLLAVSPCF